MKTWHEHDYISLMRHVIWPWSQERVKSFQGTAENLQNLEA